MNLKGFLNDIKKEAGIMARNPRRSARRLKNAATGYVKDRAALNKSKDNQRKLENQLISKIQKFYPSETVIGTNKYRQRMNEYRKMIRDGKSHAAYQLAKKRTDEFNKTNYDKNGHVIDYKTKRRKFNNYTKK